MQGARALVDVLLESGVEHIFGLPGDTGMSFYDALFDERRDRVTHIMTRDERSASFMADVYARASGRLGVCEGPSGGGATYIVPGVAEAQGSAIPLLCLTSDTPVSQHQRGVLTELDQEPLFPPVTKWNTRINSSVDGRRNDPARNPNGDVGSAGCGPSVTANRHARWRDARTPRSTGLQTAMSPALRTQT